MMNIPRIDISPLFNQSRPNWHDVIHKLDDACKNTGFFYITGHGIDSQLVAKVFELAYQFFNQDIVTKNKNIRSNNKYNLGYSPIGAENLAMDGMASDFKESFDISPDLSKNALALYPDINGFKSVIMNYYNQMFKVSMHLLEAMALALGEEHDLFTDHFYPTSGIILRFNHYPSCVNKIKNEIIAGAHTDYGYLTLLYQDDVGGLQIQTKAEEWVDVPYVEDSFVVNIGDLMQRFTNDVYKSTLHRVLLQDSSKSRISIPYFVEPNYHTLIDCLPSCIAPGKVAKYPSVLSGEWITGKLNQTYNINSKIC